MSETSEYKIESIVIAWLETAAALDSASIVHHDADDAANKDRIIVRCNPKTPAVPGKTPAATVGVWQAEVVITARFATRTAATLETWAATIDTILQGSVPAGVVSLATSSFPNGIQIDASNQGARQDGQSTSRMREKVLLAVFRE